MPESERLLVLCKTCSAMREVHQVPACFCGETAWKKAPPPKLDAKQLLLEEE